MWGHMRTNRNCPFFTYDLYIFFRNTLWCCINPSLIYIVSRPILLYHLLDAVAAAVAVVGVAVALLVV